MDTFTIDFLVFSALFGGLVTPPAIDFIKNLGFNWPQWLKRGVAIVGAALASFLAIGFGEGWAVIDPTDWEGFIQPLIAGIAVTWPVQYAAWSGLWKKSPAGEFLASVGAPHP